MQLKKTNYLPHTVNFNPPKMFILYTFDFRWNNLFWISDSDLRFDRDKRIKLFE